MLHAVFPPECLNCGARVDEDFSLCGCLLVRDAVHFRAACDLCGKALPGQTADGEHLICDECHTIARPWEAGRAVMSYADVGRKLVLGLKHGDRADIARAAGPWMARAGAELLTDDPSSCRSRCIRCALRQAALQPVGASGRFHGAVTGSEVAVQALVRVRATPTQDGKGPQRPVREPGRRHRAASRATALP
jgi:predicted amidophosphoribosyltransferase